MYPQADKTRPELWVEILSSSGKPLGMQGRMLFSGIDVDTGTGDVLVRVLVDNPQYRLLPGLYVQARIPRADYHNALSVPEQAVSRIAGQATVWLLDAQNQVQQVPIEVGELIAGHYRVLSGLSAGQQLVVEGTDRLTPMAQVVARPWQPIDAGTKLTADAP
jgi:multidrug efflux system membrane fusion protein